MRQVHWHRSTQSFCGPGGLIIGRAVLPDHFLLRYVGPGHLLTIAPTRAGKGVGAILPNLLLADRPVIVIDPKGENYRVAARARNRFGPVCALDPFGVTGNESAACNPLDLLDPGSERFAEDAAALADAIVSDPPGEVREAHWNEEAVALLSGLILLCASSEPPARRNLARVRAYLTQPPETFHQLLEAMQASDAAGGLVARAANRRLGQNEREAASVLSTAQRHTTFPGFRQHRRSHLTHRFLLRRSCPQHGNRISGPATRPGPDPCAVAPHPGGAGTRRDSAAAGASGKAGAVPAR